MTTILSAKTPSLIAVFDIDGVVRDVSGSYRRALADTVEYFTQGRCRPSAADIDQLKSEGLWNNDWLAAYELTRRYFDSQSLPFTLEYQTVIPYFQSRYLGSNASAWNGYICQEQLLVNSDYFQQLTDFGIGWGFFSGAPRAEANYVLNRLGLESPLLVAMEDAPDKPDPTGLFKVISHWSDWPVVYAGDTVADMLTVENAKTQFPQRRWLGVGILPPHVQQEPDRQEAYGEKLRQAGSVVVLNNIQDLTPALIMQLVNQL